MTANSHSKIIKNSNLLMILTLMVLAISMQAITTLPYLVLGAIKEQHHYIEVSWLMWTNHQWLFLHDGAGLYLNKPPLLFWLTNLIWHITGPNNWTLRVIPAAATIGTLFLTTQLSKLLWPTLKQQAWMASAILLGSWYFMHFIPAYMHDLLLFFFTTLALTGLLLAHRQYHSGWLLFALGLGLGTLSKGPIILIFTLPPALIAPFCLDDLKSQRLRWFGKLLLSLLLSVAVVSIWLIPLIVNAKQGTLIHTLIERAFNTETKHSHSQWWAYFVKLPIDLLPWTLWPLTYRAVAQRLRHWRQDQHVTWMLLSFIIIFIAIDLLPSKASRYMMPIYLYTSLIFSYCLQRYQAEHTHYHNKPFLILLILLSAALMLLSPLAPRLIPHLSNAHWYHAFIPGIIVFLCSSGCLLDKKPTLTRSIMYQCLLVFVLFACYMWAPMRLDMQARNLNKFEYCVNQIHQQKHPIAYLYRYGGYRYRVSATMLPNGQLVKNQQALWAWQQQHPNGIVITDKLALKQNMKVSCDFPSIGLTEFIAGKMIRNPSQ